MTTHEDSDRMSSDFDRLMTAWFDAEARVREPDDLLDRTLARTARSRPRPTWLLPERWIPMDLTMRRIRIPRVTPYLALLAVAILLAALLLAYVGSQRRLPPSFGVAANGVVAIVAGASDIATVDPVTGVTTTIVAGPETDRAPVFSRDGTRIAFIRQVKGGEAVFAVDATGSKLVRLTAAPFSTGAAMTWSADGASLAFLTSDQLWVARTDGTGARQLELGDITGVVELAWRPPDGRDLIFAGSQAGKQRRFMIKPDGTDIRRISPFDGNEGAFQWLTPSPDGRQMAYGTFPEKVIHVVSIDARTDVVVTPADRIGLNFPRWSPDGARIAVLQVPEGTEPPTHIGVIPAGDLSPQVTLLAPSFLGGVAFEWSPDATSILANQWGSDETWLLDPAGGEGRRLGWRAAFPDAVEWQRLAR